MAADRVAGVLFRGGWGAFLLLTIATAAVRSPWWALLLLPWWPLGGATATGLAWFLLRGGLRVALRVRGDGAIFVSENGSEPQYCHWVAFQDCGRTILLWGADGRYRLIIPRRALTPEDCAAVRWRTGGDLATLGEGQEVRLRRPGSPEPRRTSLEAARAPTACHRRVMPQAGVDRGLRGHAPAKRPELASLASIEAGRKRARTGPTRDLTPSRCGCTIRLRKRPRGCPAPLTLLPVVAAGEEGPSPRPSPRRWRLLKKWPSTPLGLNGYGQIRSR